MHQKVIYNILLFLLSVHCSVQERYVISCEGMSECHSAGHGLWPVGEVAEVADGPTGRG
jgi:hypothetical protein